LEVVAEARGFFEFRLDVPIIEFLDKNRIRIPKSWRVGKIVGAFKRQPLEPYLGIHLGDALPRWGAFTYSFSPLAPAVQVGRYCSISWNVRLMGPHHGIHLVSSSEILYRKDTPFSSAFADSVWIRHFAATRRSRRPGSAMMCGSGRTC
jgi:hypothetical protein